jgi:prepilin-type N-terminal cleavage/methylation domain-containing protein
VSRGFTLIELIIAIILLCTILTGSWFAALMLGQKMGSDADETQLRMELSNAMSDVRLHCVSAAQVAPASLFPPGVDSSKSSFQFFGEKDPYTVTPSILTDDTWYAYMKDPSGNVILRELTAFGFPLGDHILIESKFAPDITFTYQNGFEPNFLEVTLSGSVKKPGGTERFYQKLGTRFWFVAVLST